MNFDKAATTGRDKAPDSDSSVSLRRYQAPKLTVYGSVSELTRNGTGSGTDGGATVGMTMGS